MAAGIDDEDLPPPAELDDAWLWCWRAFWRLSADRPWLGGGMGPMLPGRIPLQSIWAWADRYGQDAEFLDACVAGADVVFIEHHVERAKRDTRK